MKKAILLMSGGVDSTTVAAIALAQDYTLYGLSFDYGQSHLIELEKAKIVAQKYCHQHHITKLDLGLFGASALTDKNIEIPKFTDVNNIATGKSITYVPARNTIFLSIALAFAETIGTTDIFFGPNKTHHDAYPDCRPEYIKAFEHLSNLATRAGTYEAKKYKIHTPLINMTKKEVVQIGLRLGVDYANTHSCYSPNIEGHACGKCSACLTRLQAFEENNIKDPAVYML